MSLVFSLNEQCCGVVTAHSSLYYKVNCHWVVSSSFVMFFAGIVSDLFPKMKEEVVDYGALEKSIRNSSLQLGLQDVNGEYNFKII